MILVKRMRAGPSTAGCGAAPRLPVVQNAAFKQKKTYDAAEPNGPWGLSFEGLETPWVQERAGDQQGWAGKLVRTAAKSHR
jgi:hypothetical protein